MKDENRKTAENGKGDAPRNNFSEEYRSRYEAINWKKKEQKPKQNTHNP
jgi:hypothetical protein